MTYNQVIREQEYEETGDVRQVLQQVKTSAKTTPQQVISVERSSLCSSSYDSCTDSEEE